MTTAMTDLHPGDTVTVTFQDEDHPGVIENIHHGWIYARITIDPELDYGKITARLAPQSTVCVRHNNIRKGNQ
jgi:hypothetical protein